MWKNKLSNLLRSSTMLGLEVGVMPGGVLMLRYVVLAIRKDTVTIAAKGELESLEELSKDALLTHPVALVISGRGLLHKTVRKANATANLNEKQLSQALPALNIADFYIQQHGMGEEVFVSLARQSLIDQFLEDLRRQGGSITDIAFGPSTFVNTWPFVEQESMAGKSLVLDGYGLQLQDHSIAGFVLEGPSEGPVEAVQIGEDWVSQEYLLAYAAALEALVKLPKPYALEVGHVQQARSEAWQKRAFQLGSAASLLFFFCLLLGNFLLFSTLTSENEQLQARLGNKSNSLVQLKRLEQQVAEKKAFVEKAGWLSAPKLSFYADRLAASVPEGLHLRDMNLNPYNVKQSKAEKRAIFEIGVISVKGTCTNPLKLNEWLKDLGKEPWIGQVANQSYYFDESRLEGKFEFIIQLKDE